MVDDTLPQDDRIEADAVTILDELVRRAVSMGASDIHLEPKRDRLQIRFRVDGEMVEQGRTGVEVGLQLISRVKVLARMDIAERRMPRCCSQSRMSVPKNGDRFSHRSNRADDRPKK